MKCKCKNWSNNLNNFVVRKLKYFKINGHQVLNNKMPAMPKEKATLLPIDNFSDIKIKEQLVSSENNQGLSTNTTSCTMAKDATKKDNKAIVVVPSESVLSPKKQPNSCYEKIINDCKLTSENSSLSQTTTMENNNTIKSAKLPLGSVGQTPGVTVNKTPSKRSANDFIFGKYIGEGSFSTVYLAREISTHREYAIKVCDKMHILRERKQDYVQRERQVMHMLANVHGFVNLYCTFQDARSLYFVMTNAKHGDLLPYITKVGSFDLACTRHYAAELVLALEVMHSRGIVHRDLKPENILLDENMHTLIADFGSAKILNTHQPNQQQQSTSTLQMSSAVTSSVYTLQSSNDRISNDSNSTVNNSSQNLQSNYRKRKGSFVGTAQYVSPEVLQSHPVSRSADLWALGCIIYQMISGLPPFRGKTDYFIFREILSCNLVFPEGFDEDAKDLVKKLLKLNAEERIGAQDKSGHYESLRSHPFFNNINWYTVRSQKPPAIYPYLPGNKEEKELRSQYRVPDNLEPGLGDRQRNRLLAYDLGTSLGEIELNEDEEEEEVEEIKTVQPYKYDFAEKEKKIRLDKQAIDDSEWHMFAENEVILKKGYINKRKGLFARRRMLLLTTGPKLIYIDPVAKVKKGEIPWSADLRVEPKNFKIFFIHTPKRTYYLEDPEGFALSWTSMIDTVRCKTYGVESSNGEHSS